ncbi:MAG: sigma-70 family RNA polymerase sigma factor [Phycisphaerae bacterium]|nr:sigma-70 family RNA polymerase sigma factor [Phycisphaerae bacterium]
MPDRLETPASAAHEVVELLARSARGDESAWRELIALYGRRVFAMARSRCRRDDVAEEITQSVFVTVATKFAGGEYTEQGRFESWLFRITMNRVRDEVRRQQRQAVPTDPAGLGGATTVPVESIRSDEKEIRALREALEALAEADREVIELRHHAGMSFNQIAHILSEPVGTVLARHHRALRKMKDHIESMNDGSGRRERGIA